MKALRCVFFLLLFEHLERNPQQVYQKTMEHDAIPKVLRYIRYNVCAELSLETLAKKACLSPFHFQRLFKQAVGETPKQYITRIRLELAAHNLVLRPEDTILSHSLDCGYNSQESFSRAFKRYYSVSPDAFRKMKEEEKFSLIRSKTHKNSPAVDFSFLTKELEQPKEISIELERQPARKVLFLPTMMGAPEDIVKSFQKLRLWTSVRELITPASLFFGSFIDYPLFTTLDKCRYIVCVTVPEKPELSGGLQYMELPPTRYATFEVNGGINTMLQQTNAFWKFWLPTSGYKMIHEPPLHIPLKDIDSLPYYENTFRLSISIEPA